MNHSTWKHAKNMIAASLAVMALLGPADFVWASFGFSTPEESKQVTVYDGQDKKVISTKSNSYKQILNELNVKLNTYDTFWTSSEGVKNGSVVVVERAKPVTIVADGKSKVVYTTQQTVQGVLHEAGFDWKTMMSIEDGMTKVRNGMQIHVVPYTARKVSRREAMNIHYNKWYDSSLPVDQEVVVQEGIPGEREVELEEFVSDGKVVKTKVGHATVVKEGVPGVAKTGNPENTVGWVTTMHASAYHPSDGDGYGITATGTKAGHGTAAVDPSVIPLGSNLFIPNYGYAVAADTGGAINGNRIDLCMESFEDCFNFGRQSVEVFVNY